MRKIVMFIAFLLVSSFCLSGCAYWPKTLTPSYVDKEATYLKEDIADSFGMRGYH